MCVDVSQVVCFMTILTNPQIVVTLGIIGSLATAMGSACSKYNRVLLPGVLATLADAKVTSYTAHKYCSYTTIDCIIAQEVLNLMRYCRGLFC